MIDYPAADALQRIIQMSAWVGDPARDLVILAEGNTSIKVGDRLLVKASGATMADAGAGDFVEIERAPIIHLIAGGTADDAEVARVLRSSTTWGERRPSVEALLHVVCQEFESVTAVIHAHPTPVNAILCSTQAHALVAGSYFPDQIVSLGSNPLLIPYIDPGLPLAHVARRTLTAHVEATGAIPKVIYLQNHGMFALGASVAEAQQITSMVVKTARVLLGALSLGGAVPLSAEHQARIDTRPDEILRRQALAELQ